MTAEVVIMNAIGVAMAADSAVSIGSDARKIFTSTDKLFQLTLRNPVGVMIYDNATLLGIPWETIIKDFRSDLGERSLPRVSDYAKRFFRFVRRNSAMFPRPVQDEYARLLIAQFFEDFREETLASAINSVTRSRGSIGAAELSRIVDRTVRAFDVEFVRGHPRLVSFGSSDAVRIRRRHRKAADREFRQAFGTIPLTRSAKQVLVRLSLEMLSRRHVGGLQSGIVFAGFGSTEYTPCSIAFRLECFAGGKLRLWQTNSTNIDHLGTTASINPYAQREVVDTFMEGVNRSLRGLFSNEAASALSQVGKALVSAVRRRNPSIGDMMQREIDRGIPRVIGAMNKRWNDFCEAHWRPVIDIVDTLPKDELAAMAEALVNLTKFRRRITPQKETVGGPIDVAVITRGDGFVWIKRKHYFDPQLNPRTIARISG
jgi:hypothetical protein